MNGESILIDVSRKLVEVSLPLGVFCGVFFVACIVRTVLFKHLSQFFRNISPVLDSVIIPSIKGPSTIWCLMLAMFFAIQVSTFSVHMIDVLGKSIMVLGIISMTFAASNVAGQMVMVYSRNIETTLPVASLTHHFARIIIFIIGGLIILNSLGISIAPILATLGVGGLAVALALQDTLANLFAGFHILIARQIRVGDFIKLESGEEGFITDINWRTTKVKMPSNSEVLVPNSKLAQAVVTNYYLPDKEVVVLVEVGVHYNSDLKKVEQITGQVAKEVMMQVPGGVPLFDPVIRYHAFGNFSINFNVVLRANEISQQGFIKHEFIKRLHESYKKEGIVIPYPIQAVDYQQEKAYEFLKQ